MARPRRAGLRARSRTLTDWSMWIVVAAMMLCSAVGLGLNRVANGGSEGGSFTSTAYLSTLDSLRIYNRISLTVCVLCLFAVIVTPGAVARSMRIFKAPIIWAMAYQALIVWHYIEDGNPVEMFKTSGVWLVLMLAMAASPMLSIDKYLEKVILLFRMLMWLSLGIGIFLPNNAWGADYYASIIPGIYYRFYGVAIHANEMGALASIAVLVELGNLIGGTGKRFVNLTHLALASILLLATQSKTSLIACAICAVYLALSRRTRSLPRAMQILLVASSVLLGVALTWSLIGNWVVSNKESLSDLSGRTELWRYYWGLGMERPWIGHGRELWNELRLSQSFKYRWAAGNAHNQFLNSFLLTGVSGVVILVVYLISLFRCRNRMEKQFRTLYTACLLFMIIRCSTEAGFEPGDMGIQAVLIGFCLCARRAYTAYSWMGARQNPYMAVNPYAAANPYNMPNPYAAPGRRREASPVSRGR